jgi:hypothetical protein
MPTGIQRPYTTLFIRYVEQINKTSSRNNWGIPYTSDTPQLLRHAAKGLLVSLYATSHEVSWMYQAYSYTLKCVNFRFVSAGSHSQSRLDETALQTFFVWSTYEPFTLSGSMVCFQTTRMRALLNIDGDIVFRLRIEMSLKIITYLFICTLKREMQ